MEILGMVVVFIFGFFVGGALSSAGAAVKINEAHHRGWVDGVTDMQAIEMFHRSLHGAEGGKTKDQETKHSSNKQKKFN